MYNIRNLCTTNSRFVKKKKTHKYEKLSLGETQPH